MLPFGFSYLTSHLSPSSFFASWTDVPSHPEPGSELEDYVATVEVTYKAAAVGNLRGGSPKVGL